MVITVISDSADSIPGKLSNNEPITIHTSLDKQVKI